MAQDMRADLSPQRSNSRLLCELSSTSSTILPPHSQKQTSLYWNLVVAVFQLYTTVLGPTL